MPQMSAKNALMPYSQAAVDLGVGGGDMLAQQQADIVAQQKKKALQGMNAGLSPAGMSLLGTESGLGMGSGL